MKTLNKLTAAFMACMMIVSGAAFTSCSDDDDDFSTQQYHGGVALNVFGPSPVARGGELRFLGSGLNQITAITLPGSGDITDIRVISDGEIRITVPQDAEPGYVVLHHAKGDITTKTLLTFTEPISLDEVTPLSVKPGETLTLKGDYLNLIKEVIFADEVVVPADEFISHSRYEIKLPVPAEAQSGKVIISDGAEIPNWIYSEDDVTVVLPSVAAVSDLTDAKPGETVTFTVADIDLVTKVIMPNEDEVEFTVDGDKLSFVLPANVSDGTICMVPASGVKVALATIGVALPEDVVADPAENIWAGDVIKIKGVNMELVNDVTFPNVEKAVVPDSKSATEITLTVPEGAQSGNLLLHTGSGASVEVAVSTLKPEAVAYDPAPAALAGTLNVNGKNLQNVVKITFAGSTDVDVKNPESTSFTVTVPATLAAGANTVKLTLSNGETVECPDIELSAPECAYATVLPGEDVEIRAGETFVVTIANADKLTGVKVNNQNVQYILNADQLIIQVPKTAGKNSTFTLVSSNGEITYNIAVIPATHVGLTIWEGMWENTGWSGNQDLAWGGYDWSQVPANAVLTLYMTPTVVPAGEWWCVSLRHGDGWGALPEPIPGQYDNPEDGILSVTLPANVLADIVANGGLVITGSQFILNKVTIEWEISLETAFWEGNKDLTGWDGMGDLAWNQDAIDNIFSTWKAGQILRAYYTCTGGSQPCLKFARGADWGLLPGCDQEYYTCDPSAKCVEYTLTAADIDELVNKNGLVIQGQDIILTKLTIE